METLKRGMLEQEYVAARFLLMLKCNGERTGSDDDDDDTAIIQARSPE